MLMSKRNEHVQVELRLFLVYSMIKCLTFNGILDCIDF